MKTARVVVIDDDRDEALLLLEALGKAGIGAVYVRGDDESRLPETPCTGVRLVFLDLKLISAMESRQYIPLAVKVLNRVARIDPGVTGIICWTKHQDEVDSLMDELRTKNLQPAFVRAIPDKPAIGAAQDVGRILAEVERVTALMHGRNLITDWEQSVHHATTNATGALWQLGGTDEELMKVLAAIAVEAADERITDVAGALSALRAGLIAVQADAIEDGVLGTDPTSSTSARLHKTVGELREKSKSLSTEQRARLNQVLITTSPSGAQPGNVYIARGWQPPNGFPQDQGEGAVKDLIREVFPGKAKNTTFVEMAVRLSVPCIVELTPACDFIQGKCGDARLVAGLLIKHPGDDGGEKELGLPAQSRMFAKEIEFVWIENEACELKAACKLILNARRLVALPFTDLNKHFPIYRLRHSVVADIRAWLGAHAARPGYIAVR